MPNIFDGLEKLSDNDIRLQIALFQSVTLGNAVKETSYKAIGKIVDFANMFAGKSEGDANRIDFRVKGVEDIVLGQIQNLKNLSRNELDGLFRSILIEKCNALDSNSPNETSSDDFLSIFIIREAAKVYALNPYLSPGTLAEKIDNKYYEQFLNSLHKNLSKETPEQAKITDNNLQQFLNKAPIESIRSMSRKIILKEFSGKGIGRLLRTEAGIKNITAVVECLGLEAFDVLQTAISSVYDTVLGINRVSRAVLAQLVWVAVNAYGKKFTINADALPGYVPANQILEQDEAEKHFLLLLSNRKDLENKMRICKVEIEKLTSDLMGLQEKLLEQNAEFIKFKAQFEELELKKYEYENNNEKTRDEIKRYYADVVSAKKNYDHTDSDLKKLTMQISDFRMKLAQRKDDFDEYTKTFADVDESASMLISQYRTRLEIVWQAYFYRFKFNKDVFEQAVVHFTNAERLVIEEYLKEMHDSMDLDAYSIKTVVTVSGNQSDETLNDEQAFKCVICTVSNGKSAEIEYHGTNIIQIRK